MSILSITIDVAGYVPPPPPFSPPSQSHQSSSPSCSTIALLKARSQ